MSTGYGKKSRVSSLREGNKLQEGFARHGSKHYRFGYLPVSKHYRRSSEGRGIVRLEVRYSRYEFMHGNDRDKHQIVLASADHVAVEYSVLIQDILRSFPVLAVVHAMRILEVFQEIFDDIPNYDDMQLPILDTDNTAQLINYCGYFDKSDSDSDELDQDIQ